MVSQRIDAEQNVLNTKKHSLHRAIPTRLDARVEIECEILRKRRPPCHLNKGIVIRVKIEFERRHIGQQYNSSNCRKTEPKNFARHYFSTMLNGAITKTSP